MLQDRLACMSIIAYVLFYIAKETLSQQAGKRASVLQSPVNPVLATLSMVTMRIYSTLDNPYTSAVLFLTATRLLHKIAKLDAAQSVETEKMAEILVDSMLVSIYLFVGFIPQNNENPAIASLLVLQGLYAGVVLTRVVLEHEEKKPDML